jgi:hypothetical protein
VNTEEIKTMTPEGLAESMKRLMMNPDFQIFLVYANEEREKAIEEGKKGRKEEKIIKQWAVIDGIDRVTALPMKLFNFGKKNTEETEPEED